MASQEELILKQFSAARQKLGQNREMGKQDLQDKLDRQQAVTGLSGGSAAKLSQKAQGEFEKNFSGADADLSAGEAQALQQAQAQKEQQEFQSGEAQKDRSQQESQFGRSFGLSSKQFEESKNQFAQQMQYQWAEMGENQKTNMINAAIALWKSGLGDASITGNIAARTASWYRNNSGQQPGYFTGG